MLIKLESIVQKIMTSEGKGESESEFGLSEVEKEQILKTIVEHDTMDLQQATDKITKVLILADIAWKPNDNEMKDVLFDGYNWEKWKEN